MLAEYIYGNGRKMVKVDPERGYLWFFTDNLGSSRLVSGNDESAYQFTQKALDSNTGLSYFGARYYDPSIGRFISVDPHADSYPALTPYHYAGNNPLMYIDPTGMDTTIFFFDQKNQPEDDYKKANYTAQVYIDRDGEIIGPYDGSTFPDSRKNQNSTQHNTLSSGKHEFNNKHGHSRSQKQGLNVVKDKDSGTDENRMGLPGIDSNDNTTSISLVNIHQGYNSHRYSEGCLTIKPGHWNSFASNFDWSGSSGTTGQSKGYVQIYRGGLVGSVHQKYLQVKQFVQNIF